MIRLYAVVVLVSLLPTSAILAGPPQEPDVNELIERLRSDSLGARVVALRELEQLGPKGATAIPDVALLLDDDDPQFVSMACKTLAALGLEARTTIPKLLELLNSESKHKRMGAAFALGAFGDDAKDAIPQLLSMLQSKIIDDRQAASRCLGQIGQAAVPDLVRMTRSADVHALRAAVLALGFGGAENLSILKELLDDERPDARASAAEGLAHLGPESAPALDKLLTLLEDENETERGFPVFSYAIKAIGNMGPAAARATPALITMLERGDILTIDALGKIGPGAKDAVSLLADLLDDEMAAKRFSAVEALGRIGPDAAPAIPRILKVLDSSDRTERNYCIVALMGIGAPAYPDLAKMFDESPQDRWFILHGIAEGGAERAELLHMVFPMLLKQRNRPEHVARAIMEADPQLVPRLVAALRDEETRSAANGAIKFIGQRALPYLIDELDCNDPAHCISVIRLLENMGSEASEAVPRLQALAEHQDRQIRRTAEIALRRIQADAGR